MSWLTFPFRKLLARRTTPANRRQVGFRLQLEGLEERALMTATASGVISGVAFADANANGKRDPGELGFSGLAVTLTGNTNQGTPIKVTASTDGDGAFSFLNVLPGSYQLSS